MNEQFMNLLEPITYDNIQELNPGEWIWDNKTLSRDIHDRSLCQETITEPVGFRQIHIMDKDDVKHFKAYGTPPFMLSDIDYSSGNKWVYFEEGRFYRFKVLHEKEEKGHGYIMKYDDVVERINSMSLDDLSSICKVVLSCIHNKLHEENGFSLEQYCSVASFGPKEIV